MRPPPESAPKYWPKYDDGTLAWAGIIADGNGWAFAGADPITRAQAREARETFDFDFEGAEFREEVVS